MAVNINTVQYWNNRFDKDWQQMQGSEQTSFFADIAIQLMPDWFKNQITKEKMTICDFGCALGQAVDCLYRVFQTDITGVDFSPSAIWQARKKYPQYRFEQFDIVNDNNCELQFDIGFVSNVLEHLTDPWQAAKNIIGHLKKYLVILMPFREALEIEEHCGHFDLDNIPLNIESFWLIHAAYQDCATIKDTLYADKQILLIYSSLELQNEAIKLDSLVKNFEDTVADKNDALQQENINLSDANAELVFANNQYFNKNTALNSIIENKDRLLAKADRTINQLYETEKELREACDKYIDANTELNGIIGNKDKLLANADQTINSLYEAQNQLQKSCNQYCDQTIELNKIISDKDELLAKADQTINEYWIKIESLNSAIREDKEQFQNQEKAIKELESKINTLQLDSDYMKNMIYNLQIENERMKKTISWRVTKPLRRAGQFANFLKRILQDPKIFYAGIRQSEAYNKYLKKYVPQKIKDHLMNKYFTTQEDMLLLNNNTQERFILDALSAFEKNLKADDRVILVFSGVKYIDNEGQRNIRLIREARKLGRKIVFAYWRWDKEEALEAPEETMVQIPIDILTAKQVYIFETFFRTIKDKCLLVEFPHPNVPQIIEIANAFGWKTVYDVIDDWEEFAKCGQAGWYRRDVERRVSNIVDMNVATARILRDKIQKNIVEKKPFYVISNGVDPDRIRKSQRNPEYDHTRGNVQIGYFGHLTDAWFDWGMVIKLAQKHEDWTFHLIGYGAPMHLKLSANIILYGKKHPEELSKYAAYWNVAMIPFINNELTRAVNPIKVFEYLQLRIPVVASDMPEIAEYPYVVTAAGENAFEEAIENAVNITMDEAVVQEFIDKNTWKNKCQELLNSVDKIEKTW